MSKVSEPLNIWMNGQLVGEWAVNPRNIHKLTYSDSWLSSSSGRPLSLSLPMQKTHQGDKVEAYFDNLLPDSVPIRQRIRERFKTNSIRPFALLREIGRDCVGAIQLLPAGDISREPSVPGGIVLSEREIENILIGTTMANSRFDLNLDDFRISIAGVQEKTAFLFENGKWLRPVGATPTTHIFKLPIGRLASVDMSSSLENEWFCSRILRQFGIACAENEIYRFGDQKCLVVKRFDRVHISRRLIRLPQEDMCQALGVYPDQKYESDGGPGITQISRLLLGSDNIREDRKTFFKSQILFWLLAAIDGHAKNFSIKIKPKGAFSLTPLYDVLSAYPVMGKGPGKIPEQKIKMAMAVSGKHRHYEWDKIRADHWQSTAARAGIPSDMVDEIINEIITVYQSALDNVLNEASDIIRDAVGNRICEGFVTTLRKLG